MANKPFDFNPPLGDGGVLAARESLVKNRDKNWNYKKYAYCTISSTGNSQTITCPSKMTIGDGSAPTGGGKSMYTSEGGIRRKKPILTSCKITNEGGQNYIDSYIYEAEFSFNVSTLSDLEKAANAFFQIGGEVKISFGWANAGAGGSSGSILVNVYNFDFSLQKDGSFDCTVKAMSGAALFPKESMGEAGHQATSEDKEALGDTTTKVTFFKAMMAAMRTAHGITAEQSLDDVNNVPIVPDWIAGGISDNQMVCEVGTVNMGKKFGNVKMPFWVTEMLSSEGTWYNDDELYFAYTNLKGVIAYINKKLVKSGANTTYTIASNDGGGGLLGQYEMFSADPTRIVLPGKFAEYGSGNSKDSANFAKWKSFTTEKGNSDSNISGILLELKYMETVYAKLASEKTDSSGGGKQPPTIAEFLGQIFNDIADVTGGFVQIQALPSKINQSDSTKSKSQIVLVNTPMVTRAEGVKPDYIFKTIGPGSIARDISFETDFDANTLMMATIGANANGNTNIDDRVPGANCGKAAKGQANADKVEKADVLEEKKSYGDDGFNQAKVNSNSTMLRSYLAQNKELFGNGYKEIVWPYKLGVTIDGVHGINYMAAISIDRLPSMMTGKGMYFSITSIEHSFDGQGDWETTLGTVMRIS